MNINSINNNQININFGAKLNVKGNWNYLSENSLKCLTQKAKGIGTDMDRITLHIMSRENILDPITKLKKGYENYIKAQFSFLSLPQKPHCTMYGGAKGNTEKDCNQNLFKALDKLLNSINDSYVYDKENKVFH